MRQCFQKNTVRVMRQTEKGEEMMKKITKMLVLALALVVSFSVGAGSTAQAAKKAKKTTVTSVVVTDKYTGETFKYSKNKVNITLGAEGKAYLSASVKLKNAKAKYLKPTSSYQKVSYSSSNSSIAKVSKSGIITASKSKTGKATITVTSKKNTKKKAKLVVKVVKGKVTSVKLDKKEATVEEGQQITLKATVKTTKKAKAKKTVIWTSSDETIATVNNKGVVTALKAGTVTITARAKYNEKAKDTCKVTVTAKPAPVPTTFTKTIVPTNGAEATATVVFNTTDVSVVTADIVKFAGLAKKEEVTAEINGNPRKVVVKDGKVTVDGKELTNVKSITVTAKIKASEIGPALVFAPASVASVTVDGVEFTGITDTKVNIAGKTYDYKVNADGSITVTGTDDPTNTLAAIKCVTVK